MCEMNDVSRETNYNKRKRRNFKSAENRQPRLEHVRNQARISKNEESNEQSD